MSNQEREVCHVHGLLAEQIEGSVRERERCAMSNNQWALLSRASAPFAYLGQRLWARAPFAYLGQRLQGNNVEQDEHYLTELEEIKVDFDAGLPRPIKNGEIPPALESLRLMSYAPWNGLIFEAFVAETLVLMGYCRRNRGRSTICSWSKGGVLGEGSSGKVYRAISNDGSFFAVKEAQFIDGPNNAQEPIFQQNKEFLLLSHLQHKNIVQVYGTDRKDKKFYMLLELAPLGSLASVITEFRRPITNLLASAYTREILDALSYLHQQDIIHRDIKCGNILVHFNGYDSYVKLADFGFAIKMDGVTPIKSRTGTVYWMAPEVASERTYGTSADIWSLGCTVLEMLSGKQPYPGTEQEEALLKIQGGERPPIPTTLSANAVKFIKKCLQINPEDRPSATDLLQHPFVMIQ